MAGYSKIKIVGAGSMSSACGEHSYNKATQV